MVATYHSSLVALPFLTLPDLLPLRPRGNGALDGENQFAKASQLFSGEAKPDSLLFYPEKGSVYSNSAYLVSL